MKTIFGDISKFPPLPAHTVLCLGYFDGVHVGHQAIVKEAIRSGNKVAVLTFDHSPRYILGLNQAEEVLSSIEDRAAIFDNLGVSLLLVANFNPPFAALNSLQFIEELNRLNPVSVYCGPDYRFGQLAKGDPEFLKKSQDARFDTFIVREVEIDNAKVASRNIVSLIQAGKVNEAKRLLGHPYRLSGTVVKGLGNGRKIGFPTANLDLAAPYVIPLSGVYATRVIIKHKTYLGVTYVGTHPTINELPKPIVETYILHFHHAIYKKKISVEFLHFLRGDIKFPSTKDLKKQIKADAEQTKKLAAKASE